MAFNILDILICVVLGLSLVSGMYKGFVTSTLSLLGFCGSWAGAYVTYPYLVQAVMGNDSLSSLLRGLVGAADLFSRSADANIAVATATAEQVESVVSQFNLPFISDMFRSNVANQAFQALGLTTMADYLTETLLAGVLNVVAFVLCFVVIYIAVLLVVNLLNNVFRFPVLRGVDWLLGGVFGLVRGAVIVMLIMAILPALNDVMLSMDLDMLNGFFEGSALYPFFDGFNLVRGPLTTLINQ